MDTGMDLVTAYEIGVKRYQEGAEDAHGNSVDSWSAPIKVSVYSVAPTTSDEPFQAGRDSVITGLTVLAPTGTQIGPYDRVIWLGEEYSVKGDIGDWNHGPFGWEPGIEFHLEKVSG